MRLGQHATTGLVPGAGPGDHPGPLAAEYPLARVVALGTGDGRHGPGHDRRLGRGSDGRAFSADHAAGLGPPVRRQGGRECSRDQDYALGGFSGPHERLARHSPALGLGHAFCVAVGLWRYLRFLLRLQTADSPEADWAEQWRHLLVSRGVRRPVPFRVSRDVGPALIWRPAGYQVVVPEAVWARLTPAQRQFDPVTNWRITNRQLVAIAGRAFAGHATLVQSAELVGGTESSRNAPSGFATGPPRTLPQPGLRHSNTPGALMQLGSSRFPQTSWVGAAHGSRLFHRIQRLVSGPFTEDSKMKKVVLVSMALGLLLVGGVRIHLVAKEPSASEATADHKPAAAKPPAPKAQAKKPGGIPSDKAAEKPKWTLADLSGSPTSRPLMRCLLTSSRRFRKPSRSPTVAVRARRLRGSKRKRWEIVACGSKSPTIAVLSPKRK